MNMPRRILVTGANGQVGHELLRALGQEPSPSIPLPAEGGVHAESTYAHPLPEEGGRAAGAGGCAVIAATRSGRLDDGTPCATIDLADADSIRATLADVAPDLILNAAAYTAVDKAEDEPKLAQRINGTAVGVIGAWAMRHGARVVHYSTDYVFDGTATQPYRESDATHPISAYGRSKLAGEIALCISGARYLIFRTAWVYAARGHNFLRTMLRLGAERDELRIVDDQVGAPTPAALIADVTLQAVRKWYAEPEATARDLDGLYHLVTSGETSWCGFARAIFERTAIPLDPPSSGRGKTSATPFGTKHERTAISLDPPSSGRGKTSATPFGTKGVEAQPRGDAPTPRVVAITTADYPTKAVRPAYSVLDTKRLRRTFGIELPDWQAGLDEVIGTLALGSRSRG